MKQKKSRDENGTCKKCGKKGLTWKETLSGFRLCDSLTIHHCNKAENEDSQFS